MNDFEHNFVFDWVQRWWQELGLFLQALQGCWIYLERSTKLCTHQNGLANQCFHPFALLVMQSIQDLIHGDNGDVDGTGFSWLKKKETPTFAIDQYDGMRGGAGQFHGVGMHGVLNMKGVGHLVGVFDATRCQ